MAPDVTLNLGATYTVPTGAGPLSFVANYQHMSSYEADTRYQAGAPGLLKTTAYLQKPTDNLDARIRLSDIGGSNLTASLWVKNLTDSRRKVYTLTSGYKSVVYSEPRSYGIDVRFGF